MPRLAKRIIFGLFVVTTIVPGMLWMVLTLGEFDYIALGERVQDWADSPQCQLTTTRTRS